MTTTYQHQIMFHLPKNLELKQQHQMMYSLKMDGATKELALVNLIIMQTVEQASMLLGRFGLP
jgi:hypothetical protein